MLQNPWKDLSAHIQTRKTGKLIRCKIGPWQLGKNVIGMDVTYYQNGSKHTRTVSPITLAWINRNWLENNVASDQDDDVDKIDVPIVMLPLLKYTDLDLQLIFKTEEEKKAFKWLLGEVNDALTTSVVNDALTNSFPQKEGL